MGGNLLIDGVIVCIIGLGTVFAVLAILWGILELMKRIFAPKNSTVATPAAPKAQMEATPAPVQSTVAEQVDEGELVAVLTAAVAASLNTSTYNLQIKSYRQINSTAPVWNRAARTENIR